MVDEPRRASVVSIGRGPPRNGRAESQPGDRQTRWTDVATPGELFDVLDDQRVDCVVCAPDAPPADGPLERDRGPDWEPTGLLDRLAGYDVSVVVVTDGGLDEYVDAGVLSVVGDVVRPGDDAELAERGEAGVGEAVVEAPPAVTRERRRSQG